MGTFQWDDSFRVEHDVLDHDHQIACDMFGDLEYQLADISRTGARTEALRLVRDLVAFMHRHFQSENDLMMALPAGTYDDHIHRHIKGHEDFLLRLKTLERLIAEDVRATELMLAERQGLLALLTDLLELDGDMVGHLIHEGLHRPLARTA